MDREPVFEFISYPDFELPESVVPATKIVHTLYSSDLTITEMREQFNYFLKACSYHIPLDEEQ